MNIINYSDDTMCVAYCSTLFREYKCNDFELLLAYGDACCGSHGGDCYNDVEDLRHVDYVRQQLDALSNEQLFAYVNYWCAGEKEDIKDNRPELERFTLWLAAGDIKDSAYCGEDVRAA